MKKEKCYAKVNIDLRVGQLLNNNYHEIKSVAIPIKFYDIVKIKLTNKKENIISARQKYLILDKIYELVDLFQSKYKLEQKVKIKINKKIPIGAGLASMNALFAGILRSLNKIYKLNLELVELEDIAIKYGVDTIFCLYNKPAIMRNMGEVLEFIEDIYFKKIHLFFMPTTNSTAKIYDKFDSLDLKTINEFDSQLQLLKEKKYEIFWINAKNDLLAPALEINRTFDTLYKAYTKQEENKINMTGSGTTLFTLDCNFKKKKLFPLLRKVARKYKVKRK